MLYLKEKSVIYEEMILTQVPTSIPKDTEIDKLKAVVDKTVERFSSSEQKRDDGRSGTSFMIDDILGTKKKSRDRPHTLSVEIKKPRVCQSDLPSTKPNEVVSPDTKAHNLSCNRQPSKPIPIVLSPICAGLARFGLYSPLPIAVSSQISYPNTGQSVFTYPSGEHLDPSVYNGKDRQVLRPAVFRPPNLLELSKSSGIGIPSASIITIPSNDCPGNRPIMWNHVIPRNTPKRKGGQIRFTSEQTNKLEKTFAAQKYLSPTERKRLASMLQLTERQVKTWFQNRRAKWRRVTKEEEQYNRLNNATNRSTPEETVAIQKQICQDYRGLHSSPPGT